MAAPLARREPVFSPLQYANGGVSPLHLHPALLGQSSGTSSIIGAYFNLSNSILGAGIVALPYAMKECGFITGVVCLIILAAMIDFSTISLIECGIITGKRNLEELCLHLFGPIGYNTAAAVLFLYAYSSMIACTVVIGDTAPAALELLLSCSIPRGLTMLIASVSIILPLSLLKDISSLACMSFVSLSAVAALIVIVAVCGVEEATSPPTITVYDSSLFTGLAMISFHYVGQHSIFLVFRSLEQPTLSTWKKVSHITLFSTLVLSLIISITGFYFFGEDTHGNILNNFSTTSKTVTVARLLMALNMICTVPVECFVARHAVYSILQRYAPLHLEDECSDSYSSKHSVASDNSEPPELQWRSVTPHGGSRHENNEATWDNSAHIYATVALWSSSLGLALIFSDVAAVLEIGGIITASALGYILPAAIYLKTYQHQLDSVRLRASFAVILGLFGCLAVVIGLGSQILKMLGRDNEEYLPDTGSY